MARDRVFRISLVISTLFHLSMVTLFTIYIWIPVQEISYYTFDFVNPETHRSLIRAPREQLQVPTIEDALKPAASPNLPAPGLEPLALSQPESLDPALPQITLPRLEVAELQRLQVREEGLKIRSQFDLAESNDPWSRFGRELGKLQDALRRLAAFEPDEPDTEQKPQLVARPAEGLALYIEWMSGPKDRELIFSPPIDALWRSDPRKLPLPIAIMFKVNPEGQVIEVLTPIEDKDEVASSAGKALLKYRFAPLDSKDAGDQYGTLLIAPDQESGL